MNEQVSKRPIKKFKINESKSETTIEKKPIRKRKDKKQGIKKWIIVGVIIFIGIIFISLFSKSSLETIKDSVVMIEVYDEYDELLGTGSGFCAYKSNYIVTNFHVIEGGKTIKIITDDEEEYDVGKVLIFDNVNDLALLKADVSLKPLKFGNKSLKSGDKVTAIGSPLGELNTVSTGIISNAKNNKGIQITASISPGSSGGALFNNKNKLIGITYATLDNGQNLNYAISVEYLNELYHAYNDEKFEIIEQGYHKRCMNSYDGIEFDGCVGTSYDYYATENMSLFSEVTGHQNRYNYKMGEGAWSNVYDDMTWSDKELALAYYEELESTYFCENKCNVDTDIKNWDTNDFMINLNVLEKEELAFVLVDLENYSNEDSKFYRVEEYPLEAAEKTLILYLIGDRPWNRIHKDNKEDIFNYFEHLYTEDFGAILETLGYRVQYNNDGTLTAWW